MATANNESVGGRSRTVYTITEEGRAALTAWLATTPQPPVLEAEALLRLLFAANGSIDDLVAALEEMASDAADLYEQVATINTSYLEGHHPFPERMHTLSALCDVHELELFDLIVKWVEFAKAENSNIAHNRGPRNDRRHRDHPREHQAATIDPRTTTPRSMTTSR